MFLAEAQTVEQSDLCEPFLGILSLVNKPADPGIALAVGSMWATHLDDGQVEPSSFFDMHVLPPADAYRMSFPIRSIPAVIRTLLRGRITEFEFCPIEPWSSSFACVRGSWLIKAAVALQSSQQIDRQAATLPPDPVAIIAAGKQNQQAFRKKRDELQPLVKTNLN